MRDCSAAEVMLPAGIQSQKWLQTLQLYSTFSLCILSLSVYVGFMMYFCSSYFRDRVRKNYLSGGKETRVRSSGTAAVKYFIACSPTLIHTYIRPPLLPK